jgi:outer membrane receptor protein involved in Fe transport
MLSQYIKLLLGGLLWLPTVLLAQVSKDFSGMVVDENDEILIGATVNWEGTTIGTTTEMDGWFTIPRLDTTQAHLLEINYVGYETATVEILPEEDRLKLVVQGNAIIGDITVESTQRSAFNSTLNPINVETLGEGELRRAACCNLSESFENNATVNVSFADAVTGAKEIEMLGLRGTYTLMQIENQPAFNRLGRAYGLEYIPGTFIQSIQIAKGASTVRNGTTGMTGQINTELIKPWDAPLLFINLFANRVGRFELNTQFNYALTQNWSTGLLVHANYYNTPIDFNEDSFLDIPLKKQLNAISRWAYKSEDWHIELNAQGILDSRNGGQTAATYEAVFDQASTRLYQINSEIRRIGVFGKIGYLGLDNSTQSVALTFNGNIHEHRSYFGNKNYDGLQRQWYTNAIFQTALVNENHNLAVGATYDIIDFKEQFSDVNNDRTEHTTALFAEYDFVHKINEEKGSALSVLVGMRGEWLHTAQFSKLYAVPRMNIKYNFTNDMVIRASAGRGVRNPNVLIENIRYMPSNRAFVMREQIMPEVAWNYGVNFVWNFKLSPKHEGSLSIDAYRTDFENQLIADIDSRFREVSFYNLRGKSFANSILIAYTQDIAKGLEARIAYKFNDVRMNIGMDGTAHVHAFYSTPDGLHTAPMLPRHRGLVALNYHSPDHGWEFNVSANWVGPQRLPLIYGNTDPLPAYRGSYQSPSYVTVNAHVNKTLKGGWQIYIGAENLTNYTQEQPILGFEDPFNDYSQGADFDASAVYAPVFGIQVYAGVKYTFEGKKRFTPVSGCEHGVNEHTEHVHGTDCEHNHVEDKQPIETENHDGHDHN